MSVHTTGFTLTAFIQTHERYCSNHPALALAWADDTLVDVLYRLMAVLMGSKCGFHWKETAYTDGINLRW